MRRLFLIIALIAVAAVPLAAHAAPSWIPIVPCGRADQGPGGICQPCHLFQGLKNVSDLVLFGITGPLAAFMIVLAGGMMLLGGANPSQYSRGKTLLTNTLTGVTVILLAWVATNFLIKSIATGSPSDSWNEFTCPPFLEAIEIEELTLPEGYGVGPPPPGPVLGGGMFGGGGASGDFVPPGVTSAVLSRIASLNGAKYPRQNSPTLNTLIDCIYDDPVIKVLTFPKPPTSTVRQTTGNFTYGNTYEACNYTHGAAIFGGSCDHGRFSCHYGGKLGSEGAQAIDLNARETMVTIPGYSDKEGKPIAVFASEERLYCELFRLLEKDKKCPGYKYMDMHNKHTHISTTQCDRDGFGAGRSFDPKACATPIPVPNVQPAESGSSGQ